MLRHLPPHQAAKSYLLKLWFTPLRYMLTLCLFTPPHASCTLGREKVRWPQGWCISSQAPIRVSVYLMRPHNFADLKKKWSDLILPTVVGDRAYFSRQWTPHLYLRHQYFLTLPHSFQAFLRAAPVSRWVSTTRSWKVTNYFENSTN